MKTEDHLHKYRNFKKEGLRANYPPSKVENYFLATFHLLEAFVYEKAGIHVQRHSRLRSVLESNEFIFGENTEKIWRLFQDLENRVRIATSYGKSESPEIADKAAEILEKIEDGCGDLLEA